MAAAGTSGRRRSTTPACGSPAQFRLDSPDYLRMGERIARLGLPTLFIMEGGYAVEAIGINAVNVLQGYEGAAR